MSTRGISASTLSMCLALVCSSSGAFAAESARAAPDADRAASAAKKTEKSPQKSPSVKLGAVQQALKRIYTIPRLSTRPAARRDVTGERIASGRTDAGSAPTRTARATTGSQGRSNRLGLQHDDAMRHSVSSVPIGGRTIPHRLGLQHDDAIRDSVSSVPIGDDTGGAIAGNNRATIGGESGGEAKEKTGADRRAYVGGVAPVLIGPGVYYHPRQRLSSDQRRWTNYRYFDGRPSRYGYGMHDHFGDGYAGDVYRFGFNKGYDVGRFDKVATERQEKVLAHARGHLGRGLVLLRDGEYRGAANAFKLAAETDQGDPAARLYAAHALFAIGRYGDAVKYLRRAFELQPKIVFLDFDIRDDYGQRADFDKQLEVLENALKRFPRNLDRLIMLGYVRYYSHQHEKAHEPLAKASKVDPRDRLVVRLLDNCRPPDVTLDEKATGKTTGSKSN